MTQPAEADITPGNSDVDHVDSDDGVPKLEAEEVPKWRAIMPAAESADFRKLLRKKHKKAKKKEKKKKKAKPKAILPPIIVSRSGCTREDVLAAGTSTFDYSGTKYHASAEILGRQPPNFSGTDVSNKLRHLTDWTTNGRPTVVCFYVPWSGPCQMQVPELEKRAHKYPIPVIPPGGVDFILCSCDHVGTFDKDGLSMVQEFHKRHKLSAPNVTNMVISEDSAHKIHQYGVEYFPHLCLINKDGVVLSNYSGFVWDLVTKASIFAEVARDARTLDRNQFHTAWQMLGYAPLTDWYLKIKWLELMKGKWERRAAEAEQKKQEERRKIMLLQVGKLGSDSDNDHPGGDFEDADAAEWAGEEAVTKRAPDKTMNEQDANARWLELDSEGLLEGLDIHQMLDLAMPTTKLKKRHPIDAATKSYYDEIDRHRTFWECPGCSTQNKNMEAFACIMCGIPREQ